MKFDWIIKDKIAASSMPYDEEDIKELKKLGINAVLCLAEEEELNFKNIEEYRQILKKYEIELMHKPIIDSSAPSLMEINKCLEWIDDQIENGKKVLVHCRAGLGRTGTILSCYLIKKLGLTAEEAIRFIRRIRPGSVESPSQILAVKLYEKHLKLISLNKP